MNFSASCSRSLLPSSFGRSCFAGLGLQLLGEFLLVLRQLARVVAHLPHVLAELAARLLAKFVAHLLEIALGAGAIGERLRGGPFFHRLRGLLRFAARLLELLALIGELRLLRRLLHLLLRLVDVGEHLLLLFLEPLELPANLLLLLLGLRVLQGGLKFLQPFVDVLLALREFLQPVEDRELFALLLVLLGLGLAIRLVALLLVLHFQFIELLFLLLLRHALALALAAAHAKLVRGEFEQCIVGGLLGGEGVGQRRGGRGRLGEMIERGLHLVRGILGQRMHLRVLELGQQLVGLLQGFGLGIAHHRLVLEIFVTRLFRRGPPRVSGSRWR